MRRCGSASGAEPRGPLSLKQGGRERGAGKGGRTEGRASVARTVVKFAIQAAAEARRRARAESDESLCYEEVWCVIDVDEYPNLAAAQALGAVGLVD